MAAVLACGPTAVLSHRSAAALWELRPTARGGIDVTIATRAGLARRGIDVHRPRSLLACDRVKVRGIPCTSVARTLLDLADVVPRRVVERAFNEAEILELLDRRALDDVLSRAHGRRGAAVLRLVRADPGRAETLTQSKLEESFLALCDEAALPQPRCQAWIPLSEVAGDGAKADFLWPEPRLVAETDGLGVHGTRRAFETDRRRDQRLAIAGYRVVRFTWLQVTESPHEVAATLGGLVNALPAA